jgi:two-component system phosphate regulon sensor histidine kinase PhoR
MPRSKPRLVVYLLLPYLVTILPLTAAGYFLFRRAVDTAVIEASGAAALEEARILAVRMPDERSRITQEWCRAAVRGSSRRLTVIGSDGWVMCDSEIEPGGMVNHRQRPEVAEALRRGSSIGLHESGSVHYSLLYAAVRVGEGNDSRVVRIGIPADVLASPAQRLTQAALVALLGTLAFAGLAAIAIASRIGRRIERMAGFSRAVAAGDLSARLPVLRGDEIGALEENLNEMGGKLRESFREVREESEKVQGILRAMAEGVVVVASNGEVILINRRAEDIFGLASGPDYRGRHLVEMCRDPELQDLLHALAGWHDGGTRAREFALAGGPDRRVLAVSVSPLREPAGTTYGFVLVFHDITELKKLETMRRDFVANVSHELRTPLTAIRGYAETLLAGALEDRQRARQFLAVIDRHSERLSRLIDDLLTLSDLELGKAAFKREAVHLEGMADEVLEVLREKAERGQVALGKQIPPDLPLLLGDGDRLQQVLINLTDNAVKYTPPGGRVTIEARLLSNGPTPVIEVEVSDTGIGIPAGDLPRLTERFYRVDKARSRELGGTGLGLAIVKHIVQGHGGQLEIASELNVGTRVRFSVPGWAPGAEP